MTYEDFLFYLPALGSVALIGISAVVSWAVWRIVRAYAKRKAVEKSEKT